MAKPAIQDEFTNLPICRQRKYQLRMLRDRRCATCGAPVILGAHCLKHLTEARERARAKNGTTRRYNSFSYRLQTDPEAVIRELEKLKARTSRLPSTPDPAD